MGLLPREGKFFDFFNEHAGLGIPVSTTHTITGAIIGVGATNRLSALAWWAAHRLL